MTEQDDTEKKRALEELTGKNVAHYSVMLAAYINTRVDANKAILALSSTGIGLLIAIANNMQGKSACTKFIFTGALVAFFISACSTLAVFISNTDSIESYIRREGKEKIVDFKLNKWKYVNYISFGLGLGFSLIFTLVGIF